MYLSPRSADSNAAIADNIAPIMNDVCRDGRNAFASVDGNHVIPVNMLSIELGICDYN